MNAVDAELDALPVREDTGVDYASTATTKAADGHEVPVDHACGHDLHMSCLLGMAKLMAAQRDRWHGTLLPLFQPAEETGDGAQTMIIVRLQTVVSREVTPGEIAIVTVGSVQAGTRSNVIPDHAVLQLNVRSYSQPTRQRMLVPVVQIIDAKRVQEHRRGRRAGHGIRGPQRRAGDLAGLVVVLRCPPPGHGGVPEGRDP